MTVNRSRGLLLVSLALILTFCWAPPAYAQRDTGSMTVRAVDPDGIPLPGVQVIARGPVGVYTQHTGIDGTGRLVGLYPGEGYRVSFRLSGFRTVIRENLIITVGETLSITVIMQLAVTEEPIIVYGQSPIVDVKSAAVASAYTDDLIDKAPTASGLWAGVLDHVPGVMATNDVGGGSSGSQTGVRAYGSVTWTNSFHINGADVNDPEGHGYASGYFSIGSFEEVGVSIAAQDIEVKGPGVNINMVIKSGSNDWHGGVRYFYEGEGMFSNNVDAEFEAEGVTEGTPNDLLSDFDVQGGGPIYADRAWFFADYWDFRVHEVVLGLEERNKTRLQDITINVNTQVTPDHKVSGRFVGNTKSQSNRGASRSRPYLGAVQESPLTKVPQLQWQAVLSQSTFMDVRFSMLISTFGIVPRDSESSNPMPGYVDRPARWDFSQANYVMRPSNPTVLWFDDKRNNSIHGNMSWYRTGETITHDVKFGADFQTLRYLGPIQHPNGYRPYVRSSRIGHPVHDPDNNPNWADGVPVEVRFYNTALLDMFDDGWYPDNGRLQDGHAAGLYFQDTLTVANKLTITAGLRFDYATNGNPTQNRLDSEWCGEEPPLRNPTEFCGGTFAAHPDVSTWTDLAPRVGLVYDVVGDGRWALKANYSRYVDPLRLIGASFVNINGVGSEDWNWLDANGDGDFQYGEQTTFRSQVFPGVTTEVDPDIEAAVTNEVTAGLDHELADNMVVGVTGIYRRRGNDWGEVDIGRPFGPMFATDACRENCDPLLPYGVDPWYPVESVDPGNDGIIGTDDDGLPVTVWALNPATFGSSHRLATNVGKYGFPDYNDYRGVSFVFRKRWSDNWQMLASYDHGRGYYAYRGLNPNQAHNNRRQELNSSRPHIFKLTGNYLFAEPVGVNLGVFVRAQSGEPVRAQYSYDDSVIEPPNGPWERQSNTTIYVDARGEGNTVGSERAEREDFVTIVDVRAEKQVAIGRYGVLHFYFDVFNLFNANTVTEFRWWLGSRYGEIYDILPPRVIRIGGAWDF